MRYATMAVLAVRGGGAATMAGPTPAAAYDYPYCAQGRGVGIPGDCSYQTYAQCMASASGRDALLQRQSARRLESAAARAGLPGLLKSGISCHRRSPGSPRRDPVTACDRIMHAPQFVKSRRT